MSEAVVVLGEGRKVNTSIVTVNTQSLSKFIQTVSQEICLAFFIKHIQPKSWCKCFSKALDLLRFWRVSEGLLFDIGIESVVYKSFKI